MKILETLKEAGITYYLVGGYVRDKLLQREANDIDLVIKEPLEQVYSLIMSKKSFVNGHLIRLIDEKVEITQLKGSLEDDLRNRDFSVNAMAFSPEETLIDVVGGIEDCRKGIIRAISEKNLVADFCRALKGVRQAIELGFTIEPGTEEIIRNHAGLINTIAPERIMLELNKILLLPRPSLAFELMRKCGLLKELMPDLEVLQDEKQNPKYHQHDVYWHTLYAIDHASIENLDTEEALTLRLAALGHDWGKLVVKALNPKTGHYRYIGHELQSAKLFSDFLRKLTYGHKLISQVSALITEHMKQTDFLKMGDYKVRKFLYKNRGTNLDLLLRLFFADSMAKGKFTAKDVQKLT